VNACAQSQFTRASRERTIGAISIQPERID